MDVEFFGGALNLMIIVVGNKIADLSSSPDCVSLRANGFGKIMYSSVIYLSYGEIVGKTVFFSRVNQSRRNKTLNSNKFYSA